MCSKYLKLNEGKTKLLLLCKPSLSNSIPSDFTISTFGSKIEECDWLDEDDDVKSLGFYLDPTMNMDKQLARIKKFCYGQLSSWKRITTFLTEDVRIMMVKQIILSKIDYNNALLIGLPNYVIQSIQAIINSAICFIYNLTWRDEITPFIYKSHILPAKYRIDYKVCATVFNCLFGRAPMYLQNLLQWNVPRTLLPFSSNIVPRDTEDPLLLAIPTDFGNRTRYRSRSFSYRAPRCWNQLPFQLRSCQSKSIFKKDLKTHFFTLFTRHNNGLSS